MIRLRQGTPGKVYTVSWVKGGGRIARPLEERGVVAGVDVTLLSLTPEGGRAGASPGQGIFPHPGGGGKPRGGRPARA